MAVAAAAAAAATNTTTPTSPPNPTPSAFSNPSPPAATMPAQHEQAVPTFVQPHWHHQGYYPNSYPADPSLYQHHQYSWTNPLARKDDVQMQHHQQQWTTTEAYSFNSANTASAGMMQAHQHHQPSEPKSGYPYYQHQMISGMEASHMLHCAGLVH